MGNKQEKPATNRRDIRQRPSWYVVRALRRARITQMQLAVTARCHQTLVSKIILRQVKDTPASARVWAAIEAALKEYAEVRRLHEQVRKGGAR